MLCVLDLQNNKTLVCYICWKSDQDAMMRTQKEFLDHLIHNHMSQHLLPLIRGTRRYECPIGKSKYR